MPTLREYLDKLTAIANGTRDPEFAKSLKGLPEAEVARRLTLRQKALRRFLDHHACTGVFNGSPVWRRLLSYYSRGRKFYGPKKGRVPGSARRLAERRERWRAERDGNRFPAKGV